MRFSDWLTEWTPVILVTSYWVVCTAIFVMCNEPAIRFFYYFYMVVNLYIAVCAAVESFLGLTPVRDAAMAADKADATGKFPSSDEALPTLDMVMVAYLPNEKDIVVGQVMYALEELKYPREKLRINLVYNTPKPIEPVETQLRELDEQYDQLRVIKVPNSKSKADNLNHFFSLPPSGADYTGVFDTDHCPHPYNPRWAAERFILDKPDIVQGRCIVYNTNESFWAKMIAIEFDKIYAIAHPGRSRMFQFGLFCGSNGWWRSEVLRELKMHGEMLTEDIDSALRAYGDGNRAVHDMNVLSYELAPNSFGAFWKQRMRWTQGWTQASIVHLPLIWTNPPRGHRVPQERLGLFSLLFVRELSYYFVSQHTCLLLSFIITGWPNDAGSFVRLIFFRYPMAEWFLFITILCLIFTLWFTDRVRSEFTSWRAMIVFSIIYTPYLILQSTMGLFGHARELVKYSSWNPTTRG
ncbi:glycosyltransferase family 2 protein [Piedraia hortae CBS 480.64]|uniref:Glycosyltransferase family 2 protein n=1 Tax=Piedraia hortae CBS 480.64 TaxID=1314780 RepID=A0A6A7C470_9PEZI|nr:glycosyltransferase family 2 protein [Piedraia hortae CBS 480.64]